MSDDWLNPAEGAASDIPKTRWLLRGLLLARAITILSGKGGSGKSLMAWAISIIVATGIQWGPWDAPATRRRVLILSAEDDFDEIRRRMEVLCNFMGVSRADLSDWVRVYRHPKIKLVVRGRDDGAATTVTDLFAEVKARVQEHDVGLITVDPYIKASGGLAEDDNDDMEEFQGMVKQLMAEADCAALMVDHQRKGDGNARDATRGASSKVDDARIACSMALAGSDEHSKRRLPGEHFRYTKFCVFKSNYGEMMGDTWFELKPQPVGNGEMRPALRPVVFEAHAGDWEHQEAFLQMVRDGRQDKGRVGWPWSAAETGAYAGRLDYGVREGFGISTDVAKEWIARYEADGLIFKEDWTTPSRNKQQVWRVAGDAT